MNTFYAWNDAPISARLAIYELYLSAVRSRDDHTALDFEEFEDLYRFNSFFDVAHKFGA